MPENSQGLVPQDQDHENETVSQEHLDWDFVLVAPPPKRSGTITGRLTYQGRSKPLAIEPVDSGDAVHD